MEEHLEYFRRKLRFANTVRFTNDAEDNFPGLSATSYNSRRNNPDKENYVDIVFVHSAEEAVGFPENVLVVWPSSEYTTDDDIVILGTNGQIRLLAEYIRFNHTDVDLRDFGLPENTVTVYDAVENWEIVEKLIIEFPRAGIW